MAPGLLRGAEAVVQLRAEPPGAWAPVAPGLENPRLWSPLGAASSAVGFFASYFWE